MHEVLEGDPIEGIVIAKFANVKAAKDWYYSEAYQSVAKHRKHGRSITDSLLKVSANPRNCSGTPRIDVAWLLD